MPINTDRTRLPDSSNLTWLFFKTSGRVSRAAYFLGGLLVAIIQAFPLYRFTLVPEGTTTGPARNVAQAYARLARAMAGGEPFDTGFEHAVTRHALIAAIERSSAEGRTVRL